MTIKRQMSKHNPYTGVYECKTNNEQTFGGIQGGELLYIL